MRPLDRYFDRGGVFDVRTATGRVIKIQAETEAEQTGWVKALKFASMSPEEQRRSLAEAAAAASSEALSPNTIKVR